MIEYLVISSLLILFTSGQLCREDQVNYLDTCLTSCPDNSSPVLISGQLQCIICDITKLLVLTSDKTRCQCALQSYPLKKSDQCAPCHYSCLTCSGSSNTECLKCDTLKPTTFRIKKNKTCICPEGYFDNELLLSTVCTKCHTSCLTCTGPTEIDCLLCAQGRVKDDVGDCICSNGFVTNEKDECVCPLSISSENICRNQTSLCGFGQVSDLTQNIAKAGKKGGASSCVCQLGSYKIRGTCGFCGVNEVYNERKKRCQCQKGAEKFKKKCILCPENQLYNKKTGKCNCKKNEQITETGNCVRCPAKSIYSNGKCTCIFNYYPGPSGACRKCSKKTDNPNCDIEIHGIDKAKSLSASQILEEISE